MNILFYQGKDMFIPQFEGLRLALMGYMRLPVPFYTSTGLMAAAIDRLAKAIEHMLTADDDDISLSWQQLRRDGATCIFYSDIRNELENLAEALRWAEEPPWIGGFVGPGAALAGGPEGLERTKKTLATAQDIRDWAVARVAELADAVRAFHEEAKVSAK